MVNKIADAILQEGVTVDFDVRPVNWLHAVAQRYRIMPVKRHYILRPVTLGTLIKISKLLIDIDVSIFDIKNILDTSYQAIVKHGETIAKIAAIAIHGKPGNVPQSLVDSIMNNFTTKDLQNIMAVVVGQMDIQNFISSIISVKGNLQVVEMSQQMPGESIASGALSAVS